MLAEQCQTLPAPPAPTREQIVAFERTLRALPNEVDERETIHTFAPGVYVRTLHLKAGDTATGKTHATEHIFILSKGELLLVTEDARTHLKAPVQAVCRPGLKRAVHALTDCIVTNVHITDETDLAALEAQLIVPEAIGCDMPLEIAA